MSSIPCGFGSPSESLRITKLTFKDFLKQKLTFGTCIRIVKYGVTDSDQRGTWNDVTVGKSYKEIRLSVDDILHNVTQLAQKCHNQRMNIECERAAMLCMTSRGKYACLYLYSKQF